MTVALAGAHAIFTRSSLYAHAGVHFGLTDISYRCNKPVTSWCSIEPTGRIEMGYFRLHLA